MKLAKIVSIALTFAALAIPVLRTQDIVNPVPQDIVNPVPQDIVNPVPHDIVNPVPHVS